LLLLPGDYARRSQAENPLIKLCKFARPALCANKPDLSSFEGHLALHQAFLEDRLEAVKAENPKLIAFYNNLNPEQKAKFERIREQMAEMRGH